MNLKKILVFTAVTIVLASCSKPSPTGTPPDTTGTKTPANTDTVAYTHWSSILPDTTIFYQGIQIAEIMNQDASGASGIGVSRAYPNMFWIENDQGSVNHIYLFDTTGTERADLSVSGATDRDWTDMSVGPGPDSSMTYVYIADIGDSKAKNPYSVIYRFPEPNTLLPKFRGAIGYNGANRRRSAIGIPMARAMPKPSCSIPKRRIFILSINMSLAMCIIFPIRRAPILSF